MGICLESGSFISGTTGARKESFMGCCLKNRRPRLRRKVQMGKRPEELSFGWARECVVKVEEGSSNGMDSDRFSGVHSNIWKFNKTLLNHL